MKVSFNIPQIDQLFSNSIWKLQGRTPGDVAWNTETSMKQFTNHSCHFYTPNRTFFTKLFYVNNCPMRNYYFEYSSTTRRLYKFNIIKMLVSLLYCQLLAVVILGVFRLHIILCILTWVYLLVHFYYLRKRLIIYINMNISIR